MLYEKTFVADANANVADNFSSDETSAATCVVVQPEKTDLEMPASIWIAMFGAYTIFFGGLIAATAHDNGTIFVIIISILYALMYFGCASLLFNQNRPEQPSLFSRGVGSLATYTGPMDKGAVAGQVLTIPACLAAFGVTMGIFRALIF
jgi:hypothetical protein